MVHMIGNADEFWRIRMTRVDTTDHFDFEWHDDILYRAPDVDPGDEVEYFHVEAVRLARVLVPGRVRESLNKMAARARGARQTSGPES